MTGSTNVVRNPWRPLFDRPTQEVEVEYMTKSGEILQGYCAIIQRKDGPEMTHLYRGWVVYHSAERLGITGWRVAA